MLVKIEKFIFLLDFIILDMEEDIDAPFILVRPLLAIDETLMDVQRAHAFEVE